MKWTFLLVAVLLMALHAQSFEEDNDFADFEFDGEEDEIEITNEPAQQQKIKQPTKDTKATEKNDEDFIEIDDDGIVEDDNDQFDEDEFEGFNTNTDPSDAVVEAEIKKSGEPKLTMAQIPMHFSKNWDSYWLEMIMLAGLLAYFSNYFVGRNKNAKIANAWLTAHKSFLEDNFALVGDDGKKESDPTQAVGFVKESDSLYALWCSGRVCCEGMLVELKMIKRQDLVSVVAGLFRKTQDQATIKVELTKDVMDTFVMAVCSKKSASKMFKDLSDLKQFCISVAKPDEKYNLPAGYSLLSEIPEASAAILDSRLLAMLNKYPNIESIHISDVFTGPQDTEQQQLKQPETKKMLIVSFFIPEKSDMEEMHQLLQLVIYLIEKLKRYRLSREGKNKADKNRQRVEEEFLKNTHAARAEAAAQKREEKRKQEKEKVMSEDNVDKQKRWEKKEKKREQKKAAPKMKQLSIKAL